MKPDAAFLADFGRSGAAVLAIEALLKRKGLRARRPPEVLRPEASVRSAYADSADLWVGFRVEVKHRKIDFTCAEDYPYSSVLIDERYHVDGRVPTLYGYYIVNAALTHAAFISRSTRSLWTVEKHLDPAQGRGCEFYAIAPGKASWGRLD